MNPIKQGNHFLEITAFREIHYFEFDKYHSHPIESHDCWEMVYVDMGEIVALGESDSFSLKQEQVIFRPPGEKHAHVSDSENANNLLVVSFLSDSESMAFFRQNTVFTLDKTTRTLLSLFINEAKNALGRIPDRFDEHKPLDYSSQTFGSAQLMTYHFTEFLIKLIRCHSPSKVSTAKRDEDRDSTTVTLAEQMIEYMKEKLYNTVSLSTLCERFFLQKSQLSSIFKEHTGKSPMRYYTELKIKEAKRLIRNDDLTVSEIADTLKFSGIHSFSRAFKTATGFSPSDYRKSISAIHRDGG